MKKNATSNRSNNRCFDNFLLVCGKKYIFVPTKLTQSIGTLVKIRKTTAMRSYIAIFPCNPLTANPNKQFVINKLKENGFLNDCDYEWKNPETELTEIYYRPGKKYQEFYDLFKTSEINIQEDLKQTLIDFKEHDKIEVEVYAPGEFDVTNPETGSVLGEDWSNELGEFLDNYNHKWTDPLNKKQYYFFELKCSDIGLGRHFITIEDGLGEPNSKLMKLLHNITGQEFTTIHFF